MPAYPWLAASTANAADIAAKMNAMRRLGVPYTDEQIAKAPDELKERTEEDALVAYLQNLGLVMRGTR
jgi:cytochrome c oxidase cbb3-type subunit 2